MLVIAMPNSNNPEFHPDLDVQLMREIARGSETAFTELIHRHQNGLLNFFGASGFVGGFFIDQERG